MCGINGIYSNVRVNKIKARISRMNGALAHRGPDGNGYCVIDDKIAFGHLRLAIVDLTNNASQPMNSFNDRYTIVYNGEIYNFLELKKYVIDYPFKSSSDTEVIIAFIGKFGLDKFLELANGMFAFALMDKKYNKLYLVRDRLGIKPLYYTLNDLLVVFSSEIKGILASGLYDASMNVDAIDDYLAYRYVREPNTFFKDIFQVPSGHYVELCSDMLIKTKKYWDLPNYFNMCSRYDQSQICDRFTEVLDNTIKIRYPHEVFAASYLSGGLDSSVISGVLFKNQLKVKTYSVGIPGFNEFEYANTVAGLYKTEHENFEILKNKFLDLDALKQIIGFKDGPLGVPNEVLLYFLSKKIKKDGNKVVFSGEGADELLGGYGRIYRLGFEYENKNITSSFYEYFINKYEYVSRDLRNNFLGTGSYYRDYFDEKICNDSRLIKNEEFIFRFFYNYHIKSLLQRLDSSTMSHGLEARTPFLDHRLIEFAFSEVPYDLKLHWKSAQSMLDAKNTTVENISEILDIPKYLLKLVGEQLSLPREIIYRKKVGFPVPLNAWSSDLETMAKDILNQANWLNWAYLRNYIARKPYNYGQVLWMLINLEIFIRQFFSRNYVW